MSRLEKFLIGFAIVLMTIWGIRFFGEIYTKIQPEVTEPEEAVRSISLRSLSLHDSDSIPLKGAIVTPEFAESFQPFTPTFKHSAATESTEETDATPSTTTPNDNPLPSSTSEIDTAAAQPSDTAAAEPENTTPTETSAETPAPELAKLLPSVPLDADVQHAIFEEGCHSDVEKFITVMAVGHQETDGTFDLYAVGDNGAAYSYLQIQPRWHRARMNRLGVYSAEELFDPVKATIVGLDYLKEIEAGLGVTTLTHSVYVIYNAGHYVTWRSVQNRATAVMGYYANYMAEFLSVNS